MSLAWSLVVFCAAAFFISLVMTGKVLKVFGRSMRDVPGARSSHVRPTPTGGGLGFLVAFFACHYAAMLVNPAFLTPDPGVLLLLAAPLAAVGFMDDKRGVPRRVRYLVHFLVACGAIWWLEPFSVPGLEGGNFALAFLLTVVGVSAAINFYNFMDGMDGLVAGVSAVQFAFLAAWLGQPAWWLLSAALLGFLFWNWPPARIFMGDAGSTVLGLFASAAVLLGVFSPEWSLAHLSVFVFLMGDALYTLIRRALKLENVFKAHHSHIYQRLMRSGLSHGRVSALYIASTAACGALAALPWTAGPWASLSLFACFVAWAELRMRKKGVPFVRVG